MKTSEQIRQLANFWDAMRTERGKRKSRLVMGIDPEFAELQDDLALVDKFSDIAKVKVKIEKIRFSRLIPDLTAGKIDFVMSGMTITEERREEVAFSDPYKRTELCTLISKASSIAAAQELNAVGARVAVGVDTTGYLYAAKKLQKAKIIPFESLEEAASIVRDGRVDAFIYDKTSIMHFHEKYFEQTEILDQPLRKEFWGAAVCKGNYELLARLNAFIGEVTNSDKT